ncbi:MAG: hypothetical protein ACRCTS_04000 [Fusobacteriaceae bacterium]
MKIERENIVEYIKEYGGAEETLKGFSEVLDKRSYFIVKEFEIFRKKMNMALPAVAYLKNSDLVAQAIEESMDFRERQIIEKIDRLSNMELKKVKETYSKLLYKNSFEYILRYGKELLLRSPKDFFDITYEFVLSDNPKLLKPLMLLAFEKIGRYEDEFIILLLSYLTKSRSDFSYMDKIILENGTSPRKEMGSYIEKTAEKIESLQGLAFVSYLKVAEKFEAKDEKMSERLNRLTEIHQKELEQSNDLISLTSIEKEILVVLLKK